MYANARAKFVADSVSTASPATLLTMLYDRLVLDLARAEQAQLAGERETASAQLVHAQDIVCELLSSLDVDAWDGGPGLASLYTWLLGEMVEANITVDAAKTAACRLVVEPLRDAWKEAARATASVPAATPAPAAAAAPSASGYASVDTWRPALATA